MRRVSRFTFGAFGIALTFLNAACTATYQAPKQPLTLPQVAPLDGSVVLNLPQELTEYTWRFSHMLDAGWNSKTKIFLGDKFKEHATEVARAAFRSVTVHLSPPDAPSGQIVLTPSLVSIDQPAGELGRIPKQQIGVDVDNRDVSKLL